MNTTTAQRLAEATFDQQVIRLAKHQTDRSRVEDSEFY